MKYLAMIALIFGLAGCPDAHLQDRAINATIGGAHQIAIEDCVKRAQDAIDKGEPDAKVWKDYDACADEAGNNARGK